MPESIRFFSLFLYELFFLYSLLHLALIFCAESTHSLLQLFSSCVSLLFYYLSSERLGCVTDAGETIKPRRIKQNIKKHAGLQEPLNGFSAVHGDVTHISLQASKHFSAGSRSGLDHLQGPSPSGRSMHTSAVFLQLPAEELPAASTLATSALI